MADEPYNASYTKVMYGCGWGFVDFKNVLVSDA